MSRTSILRSGKPYERPAPAKASDGVWQHDRAPGIPPSVANGSRTNAPPTMNSKLVVSNLHYNVTVKDLIAIFGQIGTLVREPHIKYDRSGRSTGIAYITYETPVEATRARKQFDGILAKGQPMAVVYDTAPIAPRNNPRRVVSAPSSLMDRIQKRPLLDRLGSGSDMGTKKASVLPQNASAGPGPVRTRNRRGGRGPGKPAPAKAEPKTVEQLDKELDAFMGDENVPADSTAQPEMEGDIEMGS